MAHPIPAGGSSVQGTIAEILRAAATACDLGAAAAIPDRCVQAARTATGADAALLYLVPDGGTDLALQAADGLVLLPPAGMPRSCAPSEIDALTSWADRQGLRDLCACPLPIGPTVPHGLLVLLFHRTARLASRDAADAFARVLSVALSNGRRLAGLETDLDRRQRAHGTALRRERMRALGEMAAGIADHLNTIFNRVLVQAQLAEGVRDPGQQREALAALRAAAEAGAHAVRRLGDASGRRHDLDPERLDLAGLANEALARFADRLAARARRRRRVRVVRSIVEGVWVRGVATELRDSICALLDNALDAMESGGTLSVSVASHDGEATIEIGDTGAGMTPEIRRRAREPFFTTKGSSAAGLGLAVADSVLRRHGGALEIESKAGQGTVTRLRLPVASVVKNAGAEGVSVNGRARRTPPRLPTLGDAVRPHVLLVEDDEDSREATATLLELGGFAVTRAASGAEAIRLLRDDRYDLVLTDVGMPGIDGLQVAAAARAIRNVPVCLLTGHFVSRRDAPGVAHVFRKPIEDSGRFLAELLSLVPARATAR